ncbi:MAG TPA: hypothetical protein VFA98_11215 [Thermoanaerobaculia bacterium]|jgi:hypothetical protein|nr:hypothetical protein [Thermoanaerobaculia bacterium]
MDAVKYAGFFERKVRGNGEGAGETFVTLKDDAPGWLRDAVYEAHRGALPNDWIYAQCLGACEAIDDGVFTPGPDIEDDLEGFDGYVDSSVDVYTKDRFQWATDMCHTDLFAEAEERATELCTDAMPMVDRLGAVQFAAIEIIAQAMLDAICDYLDAQPKEEEAQA